MIDENVDKDPDLRKSSDLERRNKSLVPRLIGLGAIVAILTAVIIVLIYYSPDWGPNQWGNVGTWVAGVATSLAVIVAVWQTNNANKQARLAEERSEVDILRRDEKERRNREYEAVKRILEVSAAAVTEVVSFRDMMIVHFGAGEHSDVTTAQIVDWRKATMFTANHASVTVRLELTQLEDQALLRQSKLVAASLDHVVAVIDDSDPNRTEADWEEAVARTVMVKSALPPLYSAAVNRFAKHENV